MQWWNEFVEWFYSDEGWRVLSTAVFPFLAIVAAVLVSAGIARSSITRLLARQNGESRASAVAGLVAVAGKAAAWGSLPAGEQDRLDVLASEASTRLRLLPGTSSELAASWAEHQFNQIKRNSSTFSVQAEQDFVELRDRLVAWNRKPSRARKLFSSDLERFGLAAGEIDKELIESQRRWAADQAQKSRHAAPAAAGGGPGVAAAPDASAAVGATPAGGATLAGGATPSSGTAHAHLAGPTAAADSTATATAAQPATAAAAYVAQPNLAARPTHVAQPPLGAQPPVSTDPPRPATAHAGATLPPLVEPLVEPLVAPLVEPLIESADEPADVVEATIDEEPASPTHTTAHATTDTARS